MNTILIILLSLALLIAVLSTFGGIALIRNTAITFQKYITHLIIENVIKSYIIALREKDDKEITKERATYLFKEITRIEATEAMKTFRLYMDTRVLDKDTATAIVESVYLVVDMLINELESVYTTNEYIEKDKLIKEFNNFLKED